MPVETVSRQRYTREGAAISQAAPRGIDMEHDFAHYHEALARVHHAALHGPGVAAGLAVAATPDGAGVTVGAGVAVTPAGHLVVLPDAGLALVGDADVPVPVPVPVTVPLPAPPRDGVYIVTAQPALIHRGGEEVGDGCGRFAVSARVRLVPGEAFAETPDAVAVAVVWVSGATVEKVGDEIDEGTGGVNVTVRRTGEQASQRQFESLWRAVHALRAELAAHAADRANPHGTTAAQAGALPLAGGTLSGNLALTGPRPTLTLHEGTGSLVLRVNDGGAPGVEASANNRTLAVFSASSSGGSITLFGSGAGDGAVTIYSGDGRRSRTYNTQRPQ